MIHKLCYWILNYLSESGSGSFHQHSTSKNKKINLFCDFLIIFEDWCQCTYSTVSTGTVKSKKKLGKKIFSVVIFEITDSKTRTGSRTLKDSPVNCQQNSAAQLSTNNARVQNINMLMKDLINTLFIRKYIRHSF